MRNAQRTARRLDAAPVLTEFSPGNHTDDTRHIANLADEYMTGWAYWSYKNWETQTSGTVGTVYSHEAVVDTLVRPYPPAIVGIPDRYGFDSGDAPVHPRLSSRSTRQAPYRRLRPRTTVSGGYEISVDGGSPTVWPGRYVRVRHHPGTFHVHVEITPL